MGGWVGLGTVARCGHVTTGFPHLLHHNSFPAGARWGGATRFSRRDGSTSRWRTVWRMGTLASGSGWRRVLAGPRHRHRLRADSMSRGDRPRSLSAARFRPNPIGGVKVVYQYAVRLAQRGPDVKVLHTRRLTPATGPVGQMSCGGKRRELVRGFWFGDRSLARLRFSTHGERVLVEPPDVRVAAFRWLRGGAAGSTTTGAVNS